MPHFPNIYNWTQVPVISIDVHVSLESIIQTQKHHAPSPDLLFPTKFYIMHIKHIWSGHIGAIFKISNFLFKRIELKSRCQIMWRCGKR